jgi:predicted aspartyl protease
MAQASVAMLLAALVGTVSPSMQAAAPPGGETLRTAHDPAGRMTVATRVNGQGPFPFTIDTGANRSVVLDFKRHLITISRLKEYPVDEDSRTITVTAHGRNGQLVLTDATVNGIKVFAMIDTGAENTVGNPELRRMLLGNKPKGPVGELIGVTGSRIPGEASSVPLVRIGKIDLGNMPIVYADPHTFRLFHLDHVPAILIGMDVLRKFNQVAIDFGRKEVRFNVSNGWNPRTLQALNRARNEGTNDGGARLLARTDQAGAGLNPG